MESVLQRLSNSFIILVDILCITDILPTLLKINLTYGLTIFSWIYNGSNILHIALDKVLFCFVVLITPIKLYPNRLPQFSSVFAYFGEHWFPTPLFWCLLHWNLLNDFFLPCHNMPCLPAGCKPSALERWSSSLTFCWLSVVVQSWMM